MKSITWLNEAWSELQEIKDFVLSQHGTRSALRVVDRMNEKVDLLSTMPEMGTLDTELHYRHKPVRILHSKHTRIIYAVRDDEVVIVMLWNNHQDESAIQKMLSLR